MSRYIDAEQIVYIWMIDNDGKEHDGVTLQSVIDMMPTADVRENVRGKWITVYEEGWSGGGFWKCSACRYCYSFDGYFEGDEFNYCPNCGADMRGGDAK